MQNSVCKTTNNKYIDSHIEAIVKCITIKLNKRVQWENRVIIKKWEMKHIQTNINKYENIM